MIFDGEIAGGPTTSPTLYLSSGQTDFLGGLVVSQGWLLMKEQHKTKALDGLDRYSSAAPRCRGPLARNRQGRYRERASVLAWRHPFLAGLFGESTSLYQKSAETTTLFVKRTTKHHDVAKQFVITGSLSGLPDGLPGVAGYTELSFPVSGHVASMGTVQGSFRLADSFIPIGKLPNLAAHHSL